MPSIHTCAGCGLALPGGGSACQARFDELLALEFGNILFFRVHRLTVDTYSMQHPERYCVSAISCAAHLTGLCAAMEHDDPVAVNTGVQRWLSTRPVLEKPALPISRGSATIGDIKTIDDPVAYAQEIERWARATWEAYAELHPVARDWIRQAMHRG